MAPKKKATRRAYRTDTGSSEFRSAFKRRRRGEELTADDEQLLEFDDLPVVEVDAVRTETDGDGNTVHVVEKRRVVNDPAVLAAYAKTVEEVS